jgi:hypothetical protein
VRETQPFEVEIGIRSACVTYFNCVTYVHIYLQSIVGGSYDTSGSIASKRFNTMQYEVINNLKRSL